MWFGRLRMEKSERSKCKAASERTRLAKPESVPLINGALFGCKLCAREHLPAQYDLMQAIVLSLWLSPASCMHWLWRAPIYGPRLDARRRRSAQLTLLTKTRPSYSVCRADSIIWREIMIVVKRAFLGSQVIPDTIEWLQLCFEFIKITKLLAKLHIWEHSLRFKISVTWLQLSSNQ